MSPDRSSRRCLGTTGGLSGGPERGEREGGREKGGRENGGRENIWSLPALPWLELASFLQPSIVFSRRMTPLGQDMSAAANQLCLRVLHTQPRGDLGTGDGRVKVCLFLTVLLACLLAGLVVCKVVGADDEGGQCMLAGVFVRRYPMTLRRIRKTAARTDSSYIHSELLFVH